VYTKERTMTIYRWYSPCSCGVSIRIRVSYLTVNIFLRTRGGMSGRISVPHTLQNYRD